MITGLFALDWLLIAASLFNTMLLSWLGLTVLLNAERRNWGVYIMGGGFLAGAAFFFSHTIILAGELSGFQLNINFWWRTGWYPLVIAPYAWYLVTLWYTGYWNSPSGALRRRHQLWISIATILGIGLLLMLLFFNPIPSFSALIALDLAELLGGGQSLLLALYPIFMVGCILLSIDALRIPEPAARMMGNLARERSRPWLFAAAFVLLAVGLLVVFFIIWITSIAIHGLRQQLEITTIALFDLAVVGLISAASLLIGQAIVSYEVFTGKTLPRRGFFRHWQAAIALSGGCSLLVGWSVVIQMRAIYGLMMMTMIIVTLFALFGWRSFIERDRLMQHLRPFAGSQEMTQHLFSSGSHKTSATTLFEAMCRDVLGVGTAQLIPMGHTAPLIGKALFFPVNHNEHSRVQLQSMLAHESNIARLPDNLDDPLHWALPLRSERGIVGALLISDKQDGGLYTQEEIDLARMISERIIDILASEALAERLMSLQRKRLIEHRVMDLRTRRILHDETLPLLHTTALQLSGAAKEAPAIREAVTTLADVHRQIADLIHSTPRLSITTAHLTLETALKHLIETEFNSEFVEVVWKLQPVTPTLDTQTQEIILGAVREIVRNAALHGRGTDPARPLSLCVALTADKVNLQLSITDNGVGFAYSGSSRSGGSGGGLRLHSTMLAIIGGYLNIDGSPAGGTQATITIPVSALTVPA